MIDAVAKPDTFKIAGPASFFPAAVLAKYKESSTFSSAVRLGISRKS